METLGEFLKQGREAAGLSIEDLAGRTRIRVENLQSLEREDLDALPNATYVRGFVKLVCRELGLEPSDGLLRYDTLTQRSGPPDEMTWAEEAREVSPGVLERALGDPDRLFRWAGRAGKWGGLGVAAVVALVVLVVAVRWIDPTAPRARGPVAFLTEVTARNPAPELLPAPVPPEEPPEQAAPALADGPEPGAAAEQSTEAPPESTPAAEAAPRAAVSPAPAAARPPNSPPAERVGPSASGSRLVLRVEALRAAEVTVMLDGSGYPRRRSLAAGETRTWKADRLFVVSASDGGAVRVYLGDEDLGLAGRDGEAVTGLRIRPR